MNKEKKEEEQNYLVFKVDWIPDGKNKRKIADKRPLKLDNGEQKRVRIWPHEADIMNHGVNNPEKDFSAAINSGLLYELESPKKEVKKVEQNL